MKYLIAVCILFSLNQFASASCKYECEEEQPVTNITNTTQEFYLDDSSIKKSIEQSAAQSATLETLMPTAAGKTRFNAMVSTYRGEQAIGVTAVHRFTEGRTLEVGCAYSDGTLCRAGGGFEF